MSSATGSHTSQISENRRQAAQKARHESSEHDGNEKAEINGKIEWVGREEVHYKCVRSGLRFARLTSGRRPYMAFTVTSNSFKDGDYLPKEFILSADFGFGCAGGNKSPHLKWSGAPAGTKSFAVTCFDPDAPTGS